MIEKMLNVKKAIDYGASKKTLRKATWKLKSGNCLHLKGKSRLKVRRCLSSLGGAFLIQERHNKCQKSIP
jgi:hypothetical protein